MAAVREIGFEYIETQAMHPFCPHVDVDTDDPVWFAEKAASFGIKGVMALWMANGRVIAEKESVEKGIRTLHWCKAAGIPVMHTGDGMKPEGMDDDEAFSILKDRLLQMLETAEKTNVILDIEPHGTFSLSGKGLKRILSISDSPFFGINYDAANIYRAFFIENIQGSTFSRGSNAGIGEGQGDDETEVLREILPRVKFYHAKDIKNGVCQVLGEGNVKNDECIKILKEGGYKGAVSLETDGSNTKEVEIEMAKKGIEYLRRRIN
ncbi:MAG: sugar phosphate isomerase/epimerase [Treponema sp.]|nr:sugar phosphate isomerase/epimerase [Treponema sp.]